MKSPVDLSPGAKLAVAVIVILGMLGGSLIVAYSGFATSSRRGGTSVFVPAPQAYLLAATMYGMSAIGMLALLNNRRVSFVAMGCALVGYAAAAVCLTAVLAP